jgi:hypothetical protein
MDMVKSPGETDQNMFPMDRPYKFLYSVNALSECLRQEALEVCGLMFCRTINLLTMIFNSQLRANQWCLIVFNLWLLP